MTPKHLLLFLCSFLPQAMGFARVYAKEYYVSPAGSDSNPASQDRPWRSIDKVNDTDFGPGDRIHFEGAHCRRDLALACEVPI